MATLAQAPSARRRRSREEVETLLAETARQMFAEVGFHGATTREIANRAGVSETLLFRYYGCKEKLFEAVVAEPFEELLLEFSSSFASDKFQMANFDLFIDRIYSLTVSKRALLKAYLLHTIGGERTTGDRAFEDYFQFSVRKLQRQYADAGGRPDLDIAIAVRAAFSMVLAPVLSEHSLFSGVNRSPEQIKATLRDMLYRIFRPEPLDGAA